MALRSVGVTAAAMGLSRLFQGPNTDFTTEPRPRPLSLSTAAAYLPIHPHPPYSAHAPHTYRTRGIDRPRGSEISKTRPLGGRRAERVEVLFDDLLALVHDPPVLDSGRARPPRRLPTLHIRPVRGPAPGLPPGRPQTRVLPSPHLGAPLALCRERIEKGRIHTPSRQGSLARTPDLTSATCLCLRLGP